MKKKILAVLAVLTAYIFLSGFSGMYFLKDKEDKIENKRPQISIVATIEQWGKTPIKERIFFIFYLAERLEEFEPQCSVGIIQPGINETHIRMDIWCVKREGDLDI